MKTMPDSTIIPVLPYPNLDEAIAWLTNTLGFTQRWRIGNHRAQLSYGNCTIAITESPAKHPTSLIIQIKNLDTHFTQSQTTGQNIISPPADQFYGERQYTLEDLGGHFWTLSETIKELTPEDWGAKTA